jgi:predicted transposase YbfD/YdcC
MDEKRGVLLAFEPFLTLPDPRSAQGKRHELLDIIVIALCGAVCGVDNAEELQDFGEAKEKWFRTFLDLRHGIPSQDTFLRVFAALDPVQFRRCFVQWVESLREQGDGKIVAVDGKSIRRAFDSAREGLQVHMVNAWLREEGLVLGSMRTAAKSNEITAIPELLRLLNVKGCTVTTDAMGCQREIAKTIVAQGGEYMLQVAENHPTMHAEIVEYFDAVEKSGEVSDVFSMHETVDGDHGRVEERKYWHTTDIEWFEDKARWKSLRSFAKVTARRTEVSTGKTSEDSRYYISSYGQADAERAAKAIRGHWGVENELHWVLDMAFDEDRNRCRTGDAAENFAIVRHVAVNLIKGERSKRKGVLTKRKRCGWDHEYLLKVIGLQRSA